MTDTPTGEPEIDEPLILERLSDLEDQDEYLDHYPDIRGRAVVNPAGDEVGTVDDLFVNPRNQQVEMAEIAFSGAVGYGGKHVLVPVEEIRFLDGTVRIITSDERIKIAPEFHPGASNYEPYFEFWSVRPDSAEKDVDRGSRRPPGRLELEGEDEEERVLTDSQQ